MQASTTAQLGRRGERAATRFVRRLGWDLLARNWRHPRFGEIDLVALDGTVLVFVEVKARRADSASVPEDALRREKREHLRHLAGAFMLQYNLGRMESRFDLVAVTLRPWPGRCEVRHYPAAFS